MSTLSVALSAVVLMAGLLIASAIMAADAPPRTPFAQMNRAAYATLIVIRPAPAPVAQMNRASYRR